MEDVSPFQVERPRRTRARLSLYLSQDALAKLSALASRKRLDYRTLAETFVLEGLMQKT
jgi:hypothetical protein